MTQKYYELERMRDKLCSKRRLLQAQLNMLDDLIHEIHNEMDVEIEKYEKALETLKETPAQIIKGEK